jgi:hypothetical protein
VVGRRFWAAGGTRVGGRSFNGALGRVGTDPETPRFGGVSASRPECQPLAFGTKDGLTLRGVCTDGATRG